MGQYKNINEKLIQLCLKGNSKAQFELYQQYAQSMYNVSFRILKNSCEAEDAMQDGFLKAFKNINSYSGEVSFGAWLKKIIINTSLDVLRKQKIEFTAIDEANISFPSHDSSDDENEIGSIAAQIKKIIYSMSGKYRTVLSLYLLEGYDHTEIAEIIGGTVSSSRSNLSRAKKKVLEVITENYKGLNFKLI